MYKKSKKLIVWCLVISMVLTQMLFTNAAFAATNRLYGSDRYETAIKISQAGWAAGSSEYAVIAYGEDFPDALAAAPLAKKYNAPILLTGKSALASGVLSELQRIGVKNVFIVGGEGVVAPAVAAEITAAGISVERLFGADRYATSLAVANKIGATDTVVVAYGENYPDALSVSAIAAAKGWPILLTGKDAMSDAVKAFVGSKKAYIIGGTGVVSDAVLNVLANAERISGADRYATNVAVLTKFNAELNFGKVYVATGEGFADALTGSVLAAKNGAPVVLVGTSNAAATYAAGKVTAASEVVGFGGAAVVSDSAIDAVKAPVVVPSTLSVESVSTLNLNQIKVVFNKEVDETSAEEETNYVVDGADLADGTDSIVMQSDKKTVIITLDAARTQYEKVTVIVKKAVLSKDMLQTAPRYETELTFSDIAVPTVKAVSVSGNKKVTVEFSEAVDMTSFVGSDFKINDQSVINYGYETVALATSLKDETASNFTNKVELTFATALPTGNNTLTIPAGESGWFEDAAGFMGEKVTVPFTVAEVTTAPKVVSVTGENNGTIYVTYDRSMKNSNADDSGALTLASYVINGGAADASEFKSGTDYKVVKLTFDDGEVVKGVNVVEIDKDMQDTYGNKLDADNNVRVSFTATEDTTKPSVVSVTMINNETIRIKFSETVDHVYAQNLNNYTLKSSSGSDKSGDMQQVDLIGTGTDSDTYDIIMNSATPITGSNYTLKIENIYDLAATANSMDDYTATVSGNDDVEPVVNSAVAVSGSTVKVTVFFSEEINSSDLTNKANYAYGYDGAAPYTYKALPSNSTLAAGEGNKSVTITFPSSYTVEATPAGATEYFVQGIRVANVKDLAGNVISGVIAPVDIIVATAATNNPVMSAKTSKIYESGSVIYAEVEYDQTLSKLDKTDYTVAGQEPDQMYLSGKKLVMKFTDSAKRTAIKADGASAVIEVVKLTANNGTKNAAGVPVAGTDNATASKYSQTVYDDAIAPKLLTSAATDIVADASANTVVLTFSEDIDDSVAGLYKDDFTFVNKTTGVVMDVVSVSVVGDKVTYTLEAGSMTAADVITVKAVSSKINIKDVEDAKEDQNLYVPSSDDASGYDETVVA